MRLTKALFEGLARLDGKEGRPIPALAERWSISSEGNVYTFYLRSNPPKPEPTPATVAVEKDPDPVSVNA